MRFYHLDLFAALGTPRLTWRRLGVLLHHLPRESAYVQAVAGARAMWGHSEYLLARLIDEVRTGNHMFERVNFKGRPAPPRPLPRPGDPPSQLVIQGRRYSREQIRARHRRWGTNPEATFQTKEV